jgi:hypothetical protein
MAEKGLAGGRKGRRKPHAGPEFDQRYD